MWVPKWLGEGYAKLYARFGRGLFGFDDAEEVLGGQRAQLVLSGLRRAGALIDYRRTRPRVYRLLDPRSFMLVAAGVAEKPEGVQGEYVQLVYDVLRGLMARWRLDSFLVYGSVARGKARAFSDLDLLVVSGEFQGSIASRIDRLLEVEEEPDVVGELRFLRSQGIHVKLSFYPLRPEEAESLPLLFLDLIHDSVIILDRERFMRRLLSRLKAKLESMGAERRKLPDGRWYWDLGPRALEVWGT